MAQPAYFAADGNYGDASDILIVDTENWTNDDWADMDEARDSDRLELAKKIAAKYNKGNDND